MNDHPPEVVESVGTESAPVDDRRDIPEGTAAEREEAEVVAQLRRSMADFEAGRYRPAREVMREIAAEEGIPFNDEPHV